MTRWIVPIMGFTEGLSSPSGVEKIWTELRKLSDKKTICITPRIWSDDMDGLASFISRNSDGQAQLFVVAYSWGCGQGFVRFAEACKKRGIAIITACLCDPVYRSRLLPKWLPVNPLSLTKFPKIEIPSSVRRVVWVRQHVSVPAGHDLVVESRFATTILAPIVMDCPHVEIDDSPVFHELVYREAREFLEL